MERNKLIYALSDAAWWSVPRRTMAERGLEPSRRWTPRGPVYVKTNGTLKEGNRKLLARGGRAFSEGPMDRFAGSLFASLVLEATLFDAGGAFQEAHIPCVCASPATDHSSVRCRS